MAWFVLIIAGLLEVVWAYSMKLSERFSRPIPTLVTFVTMAASYRNSFRTSGYIMLGLSGSLAIEDRTELFADLRNLTARKAVGDISAVIARSPASAIFYPVERRGFSLGLRSRFGGGTR